MNQNNSVAFTVQLVGLIAACKMWKIYIIWIMCELFDISDYLKLHKNNE